MYEYLIGIVILAVIWATLFKVRSDLRKPMIWSGLAYMIVIIGGFSLMKIASNAGLSFGPAVIPGYWNPDTLFNLGRITGGLSIEDILFMFFVGGIATVLYDYFYGKRIALRRSYHPHIRAVSIGVGAAAILMAIAKPNPIYPLILFGFVGAIALWIDRRDLFTHSLIGGVLFMLLYALGFQLFLLLFPDYISQVYSLGTLSGIIIFGLPLEEYLYAFSFGLLWAPMYEYAHGEKCVDEK